MELKDFRGRKIELSDDSWVHIQESHPEVSLEEIKAVLIDPNEVIECPRQQFVELFYRIKLNPEGKPRFRMVVVKVLPTGNYISTAMTTTAIKQGRSLYKKGESI